MRARPATPLVALSLPLSLALSLGLLAAAGWAAPRRAFITSLYGPGDLGGWVAAGSAEGLAAGDAICRALALDAGLENAETFRAWLSDDTTDAWCHLQGFGGRRDQDCDGQGVADPAQGPWVRVGGAPFAGRLIELADPVAPRIYQPLVYDETGETTDFWGAEIWTGSSPTGTLARATCSSWSDSESDGSGGVGNALDAGPTWSDARDTTCNSHKRLYCFEPGAGDSPHAPAVSESVTAFLSSAVGGGDLALWPAAGGLLGVAAADQVCRALASAAGLPAPASYLAWLSDDAASAAEHLGELPAIRRVDGFPVAPSLALLLAQPAVALESALVVTESCQYGSGGGEVWTGTSRTGVAAADRCAEWTSAEVGAAARVGRAAASRSGHWTDSTTVACDENRPIYCFSTTPHLFWDRFECGSTIRWSAATP